MQLILENNSPQPSDALRHAPMGKVREPLDDSDCGLPLALEVIGERWSLMILRAAFNGVHHFEDFLAATGIARNILSNRLVKLVEHGIMVRQPMADDRRRVDYRLTQKGLDLLPATLALRQWGEKYGLGVPSNPVLVDKRDFLPIAPITIHSHDGRALKIEDLQWRDRTDIGRPDSECCGPGTADLPGWSPEMTRGE